MTWASVASTWFDVTYYNLDLNIFPNQNTLQGVVTINGVCRQNNSGALILDLANAMQIDSIFVNGSRTAFAQSSNSFELIFALPFQSGNTLSILIHYQGTPVATGFGSFIFTTHAGTPWVYSLSEPYGASDWFPCKNVVSDKADSTDIIVTCDSIYKVGSQGILDSVVNRGNGKSTYYWRGRYPISTYLMSVSLTNYAQFSNWFRYSPTDSMEVLNYILPEHLAEAKQSLPIVIDQLAIFSELFGLYPFIKEKYGHAEYVGGGMEHQTMTSLGRFDENLYAHELAHQWFGDMITCRTWSDLWLNEGFAQYATGLYREKKYGTLSYWEYMTPQLETGMIASGAIGAPDTVNPNKLFNFALMYAKGASVLHMLRHVLGDSIFFRALYVYANDPILKYSTATTKDFQKICERVSAKDLEYFFQQWIYGENIPTYEFSWNWESQGDSSLLRIELRQPPDRMNPQFFTMPLDFRIRSADRETTVTLFSNALSQSFSVPFPSKPISVHLDPDGWVLKRVFSAPDVLPSDYTLLQNYPNPFNSSTTIEYRLPASEFVSLSIFDVLGRRVTTLVEELQIPGNYTYQWKAQSASSGVYFYHLIAGDHHRQKKMMLLR